MIPVTYLYNWKYRSSCIPLDNDIRILQYCSYSRSCSNHSCAYRSYTRRCPHSPPGVHKRWHITGTYYYHCANFVAMQNMCFSHQTGNTNSMKLHQMSYTYHYQSITFISTYRLYMYMHIYIYTYIYLFLKVNTQMLTVRGQQHPFRLWTVVVETIEYIHIYVDFSDLYFHGP